MMVPPQRDVDDNHASLESTTVSDAAVTTTEGQHQQQYSTRIFLRRPQQEEAEDESTNEPFKKTSDINKNQAMSNSNSNVDDVLEGGGSAGGQWMRENDAEILEKGINETCSTGETPIMTPIKCTPPTTGSEPLSLPPQSLHTQSSVDVVQKFTVVQHQQQQRQQGMVGSSSSSSSSRSGESVDVYIGDPRKAATTMSSMYDSASLAELRNQPNTVNDNTDNSILHPSFPLHTLKEQQNQNNNDNDNEHTSSTNEPASDLPPLTPLRKVFFRRCLSGDERVYQVTNQPIQNDNDFLESSSSSIDVLEGNTPITVAPDNGSAAVNIQGNKQLQQQHRQEETPELIPEKEKTQVHDGSSSSSPKTSSTSNLTAESGSSSTSMMQRSKSRERLFSEAIQFAEAVGEAPPAESELQKIIEDDGSDEDDESDDDVATEILIDKQNIPSVVSSSSPQKLKRLASPSDGNHSGEDGAEVGLIMDSEEELDENSNVVVVVEPPTDIRSKLRWLFKPSKNKSRGYLHSLPENVAKQDYQYKGICANPPEITKRGISRGNYAQLHRKAWLEVSDKYHRYGKNLRTYYRHWESLGHPTNMFFDWLDSKGEAAGQALPNLEECPRAQLDSDTVLYINNEESQNQYQLTIVSDDKGRALLIDIDGDPVMTGPDGWIIVLRDHKLYGSEKITSITGHCKQRFHHSSFFSGKAVAAAGIVITDEDGFLTRFYPHSGHYRPGEAHVQRMLFHLHHCGIDLRTFEVDTQQILHVNRKDNTPIAQIKDGGVATAVEEKKKKIQSLHLKQALYVACLLAHKARFIGEGICERIHKIRKADVASVTEALDTIDNGGYWKKLRLELSE